MSETTYNAEVVIAGGGLAGMTAAYELLDRGKTVLLIDKDCQENFGGLAKESFGGVMMVDTPYQRRSKIKDSPELAMKDWESYAQFGEGDVWPRKWAEFYCHNSDEYIFRFMDEKKIKFLPVVNWPEQGLRPGHGNSLPRWHITFGTGWEIIDKLLKALEAHPNREKLSILFNHEVSGFINADGDVVGVYGRNLEDGSEYAVGAEHTIIASGGICGGDLSTVKANWYKPWGDPPGTLLNGAHDYGDGMLHFQAKAEAGANLTHLDKQWHYAAGVHHPTKRRPHDGISLVPPRSALWVNARGARIRNPDPLIPYTDTRHLVESILMQPGKYSWQVMNWKIAIKELAVSGCSYMRAFREKKKLLLAMQLIFGNKELVNKLIQDCPDDIVVADSYEELVKKMNEKSLFDLKVDSDLLEAEIRDFDNQIDMGEENYTDPQLKRLVEFRKYRGDRLRMVKNQKILDPKAMPLIAIREFILARKSLGGIQTDLESRVLHSDGAPISGLYAVGEAAGFGGGGIHGMGSLEGTFLGSCILTARQAGRSIAGA